MIDGTKSAEEVTAAVSNCLTAAEKALSTAPVVPDSKVGTFAQFIRQDVKTTRALTALATLALVSVDKVTPTK